MSFQRILTPFAFLCFFFVCASGQAQVAETPPMGWNSYNCYGSAVHEDEVKANTDYMSARLKRFGWQYIVVDFLWSYPNPPLSHLGTIPQKRLEDGSYIPWLEMDQWGRLIPDAHKFPSATPGRGFRPLADYIHQAGLKFGIHVMRGIPRQAVFARTPVFGAPGITADMIADTNSVCPWNNHMYGLDMKKKGAQEYLNSLLQLYALWQVDFIKVDDLARPYSTAEVEGYRTAIDNSRRPMVFSLSPGATPLSKAAHVAGYGTMWRLADDFWDSWAELLQMFKVAKAWEGTGGPGHWPDCDMLQIGKLSKRGPVGPERYSRLTPDELTSHMTFWAIYRSPLMIGGNLPENRPAEDSLYTNAEVIAVNQHGEQPREVIADSTHLIWISGNSRSNSLNIAVFNLSASPAQIQVNFSALGLDGQIKVRDTWARKELGSFNKQISPLIGPHGAVLLKLTRE